MTPGSVSNFLHSRETRWNSSYARIIIIIESDNTELNFFVNKLFYNEPSFQGIVLFIRYANYLKKAYSVEIGKKKTTL